jgi:signal transduction histidine kinase
LGRELGIGLLLVYFVYGLAFWTMGLAVLLESGRAPNRAEVRSLRWLASFGIVHGTHEWLEAYLLLAKQGGMTFPDWLQWLRVSMLVTSFGLLLGYALSSLRQAPPLFRRNSILCATVVFGALGSLFILGSARAVDSVPPALAVDVASRYLLAVPAALLASLAMWSTAQNESEHTHSAIGSNLRLASIGFALYGLSQFFVAPMAWFPANTLNQTVFVTVTGVPVQALRALAAVVISIGLLRAMQAAEQERQRLFVDAQRTRLAALVQQDALRRDLLRHVVRSQEEERSRISRELHDQVAQLLTAFSLELASLRSKLRRPETVEMVTRLQQLSRQMSERLHNLVSDLRPSQLDTLGLVPALKALLGQEYGLKNLEVTMHISGHSRQLDSPIDTALFRVAQQALTNVSRHAHVDHADLELHYDSDHVTLRVRDQGCGFDPAADFSPPRGWGLAGMRERVEALGGEFALRSSPGLGTTVEAVMPLRSLPAENPDYA